MERVRLLVLLILVSIEAAAQPLPPPPQLAGWCATSPARTEELRARHEWRAERRIGTRATTPPRFLERDGMFIVEADDRILVNDDLLDLVGRTLRLTPAESGYLARTVPIDYRDEIGSLVADFSVGSSSNATISIPFSFPFHGFSYDDLFVNDHNGIYFSTPQSSRSNQYEATDAAAIEQPVISPLLFSRFPRTFVPPRVYAKVSSEEAVVTWRADSTDFGYDIQARLGRDGSIDLSWRSARDVEWGAVVVTPGLGDGIERESLVHLEDSIFDATVARPDFDLVGFDIERIEGTDLIEVRMSLRGLVRRNSIEPGEYVQYGIDSSSGSSSRLVVHLERDGEWIYFPDRGWVSNPGSLDLGSNAVRFLVSDRYVAEGSSVSLNVWIWDGASSTTVDSLQGTMSMSHSTERFELDLGEMSPGLVDGPIVETFTLPDMDPYEVWERLSQEYEIDPAEPDAIAIYQDFFTDLVLYAGAYSTVGNPVVDGIANRSGYGTDQPPFPALLHMSKLGYRYNSEESSSVHVQNHEFGHRWLYFFEIIEDGESRRSLNPGGGHPAQFVHTPAAFDVRGQRNSSAMGGSWFDDLGNGTFRSRNPVAPYGYSWHELYLMGLADPEEVEPWFYIANSDPRLGDAYYPPNGVVVSGDRHDVTIDQLLEAMGPRVPDAVGSRKRFQAYFVLLVRDLDAVTEEEIADLEERRRLLAAAIPIATGGRASVDTRFGDSTPRNRGVRRP